MSQYEASIFSINFGRRPVGRSLPTILPFSMPICSKTNRSVVVMTSLIFGADYLFAKGVLFLYD